MGGGDDVYFPGVQGRNGAHRDGRTDENGLESDVAYKDARMTIVRQQPTSRSVTFLEFGFEVAAEITGNRGTVVEEKGHKAGLVWPKLHIVCRKYRGRVA